MSVLTVPFTASLQQEEASPLRAARVEGDLQPPMQTPQGPHLPIRDSADDGAQALRFGARVVFTAGRRRAGKWRTLALSAAGLLCVAVGGGYIQSRLAGASVRPEPILTSPPPPLRSMPAPVEPPTPPPRRAPRNSDGEQIREIAERVELLRVPEETAFRVTRRTLNPETDQQLSAAYAAYLRGDGESARASYDQTLAADPVNHQALLGVAVLASRRGDQASARRLYLRLLERQPDDPLAWAGLLRLQGTVDPQASEAKAKALLVRHPGVAALHLLLAEFRARDQRWSEAHLAYAKAFAIESATHPDNKDPDLPFDLAVTLEHLGRGEEALLYYRLAVEYAGQRTPGFDPAIAEARVRALMEI